jgi:hypothetical protein
MPLCTRGYAVLCPGGKSLGPRSRGATSSILMSVAGAKEPGPV